MENVTFSDADVRLATLAGQALPYVVKNPARAYARAIAAAMSTAEFDYSFENNVSAALRYLERMEYLISSKVRHPDGHAGHVRLYSPTPKGAFMIGLVSTISQPPKVGPRKLEVVA